MTILPLVGRELLVRARSPAGHWTRLGAALAGMLFFLPAFLMAPGSISGRAQLGAFAFNGLVTMAFILCCFSGFLTVDGISRERREGTLGLLFLTRVRALDVLLGNFGAAGIASLSGLIAFVPVLIVPVLAGGVNGGEAARKVLVLLDTMVLSLAAGLWASARGSGWLSSARSAAGLLAVFVLGPLVLEWVWLAPARFGFAWPGPLSALAAADASHWQRAPAPFWISISVVHAVSWLLVVWAGIRLHRSLREDDEKPDKLIQPGPNKELTANEEALPGFQLAHYRIAAPARKRLAADEAPLEWLVSRQRGVSGFVWLAAILETLYHGVLLLGSGARRFWGPYSAWGSNLAFSLVEGCLFAWAASRFFIETRRGGELELLLTTPEGARNIVASEWKWLKKVFRLPIVLLMLPSMMSVLIFVLRSSSTLRFNVYGGVPSWWLYSDILAPFVVGLNLLAGTGALVWAGMWYGCSERSQTRAVVRTVILAKGLPYIISMLGSILMSSLLPRIAHNGRIDPWYFVLRFLPDLVQLTFYIWLFQWAKGRLERELPQAARTPGLKLRWPGWLGYE